MSKEKPDDPDRTIDEWPEKPRLDSVTIPRARYEALMGAADDLFDWQRAYDRGGCVCIECLLRRKKIAALRSAGIEETR